MRRRKRYRRAGVNHVLVTVAVFVAVGALGIWAFDMPQRLRPAASSGVAEDGGSVPRSPDAAARADAALVEPGPRSAASIANGGAATAAWDAGLSEQHASSLAGAKALERGQRESVESALSRQGSSNLLDATPDPGMAAQLQAQVKQSQAQLEALGHTPGGSIPEDDPAMLEQLPPEIRQLYQSRRGNAAD
jgi:hypothetical protein